MLTIKKNAIFPQKKEKKKLTNQINPICYCPDGESTQSASLSREGGGTPRDSLQLKRDKLKNLFMPLFFSQPFAITTNIVIDNGVLKAVGSCCVSLFTTWLYLKYKK
jgi:hypothetical protein